jgi:signal transduction histidine kinase
MQQFEREMEEAKAQVPSLGLNVPRLRLIAVVAPAVFAAGLVAVAALLVEEVPLGLLIGLGLLAATAAAALFSGVVFDLIERSEYKLVQTNEQLAAFRVAAMTIAEEYQLGPLLQRFVDISRQLTGARYAALSVINTDGSIREFITSGITEEEREAIGAPPIGRGLLGAPIHEGTLRLDDMSKDARSMGFPANHPPMKSLLGVPVQSRRGKLGNLYLTDKIGASGFNDEDEQMVRTFAAHAALAIETSRFQDEARSLAVLRERERIGMDLHDGIIQSIYAVELGLEGAEEDVDTKPAEAKQSLEAAIDRLDDIIGDVRSYIFELRPAKLTYDLSEDIMRVADEFRAGTTAELVTDIAPALPVLPEEQAVALIHITRDALANANRHAHATRITVSLHTSLSAVSLTIRDNGVGFDPRAGLPDGHHGLRNMAFRAREARGIMTVDSARGTGTTVRVEFPLHRKSGDT